MTQLLKVRDRAILPVFQLRADMIYIIKNEKIWANSSSADVPAVIQIQGTSTSIVTHVHHVILAANRLS